MGNQLSSDSAQASDIRLQLDRQLRCLDERQEQQVNIVAELQEFYRRRADVEIEHAKSLDRLAKNLTQKQKTEKQRRDQWPLCSVFSLYETLIHVTKKQSRDHAVLGELLQNNLVNRLVQTGEDLTRIYRKCRDIGVESHEELFKVHNELHTALKTYFLCLGEFRTTETKFLASDEQRKKMRDALPEEKRARNRKLKVWTKECAKKEAKYGEAKLKLLKARNEYLLSLNSANAALQKYFAEDLPELMDCMDFGLHRAVSSAMKLHQNAFEQVELRSRRYEQEVKQCIDNFDSRADKQKFIEAHHTVFMLPRKFDFRSQIGEDLREVTNDASVEDELKLRFAQLGQRLTALRTNNEEIWKTLDSAERTLIKMIDTVDCDVEALFNANGSATLAEEKRRTEAQTNGTPAPPTTPIAKVPETAVIKKKADKAETEQFYLTKFQEYTLNSNLMTRLQAKQKLLQNALGPDNLNGGRTGAGLVIRHSTLPPKPRRRRIAQMGSASQRPKLFGGSLEEYLEATGQEIPLILTSCIRVIRLYGLHHQGIFRISGSQIEINNFRDAFERGEDPLADVCDGSDMNNIAGVFKLYLRDLREALFPLYMFDQLMEISKVDAKDEFVKQIKELLMSLPRPVFVVLRYLIAFLNHLSEFSDENMMDRFNLAICFGPTLLPIPESRDQVQYQQRVNVLIKNIFLYQEDIFPANFGTVYEKYDLDVGIDATINEGPGSAENLSDEEGEPLTLSEEDTEHYEATAVYAFKARNDAELTMQKGDSLLLLVQMNPEWWKARLMNGSGNEGLVPDKYVEIKRRISSNGLRNGTHDANGNGLQTSISESLGSGSGSSSTATSGEESVAPSNVASTLNLSIRASPVTTVTDAYTTATDSSKSDEDGDYQSPWKFPAEQLVITEKTPREELEERRRKGVESATASYPIQTTPVPPTSTSSSSPSPKLLTNSFSKETVPRYYFGSASPSPVQGSVRSAFPQFQSMRRSNHPETISRHPEQASRSLSSNSVNKDGHTDTPDLVLNLPLKSDSPSYRNGGTSEDGRSTVSDQSPEGTVAEQFARSNQGTMKKGDVRSTPQKSEGQRVAAPASPSLNNFSLGPYKEQSSKVLLPKYDVSPYHQHHSHHSDPSASIDELLESLKAVASPSLTGGGINGALHAGSESPRPVVAPKPQLKSKPTPTRKPLVVVTSGKNSSDVLRTVRDASSKPTSC
ncbi:SLIT-ROBO Rho GTPase-activating protein 3 [Hypsibius exemplaris]|uniref:SLIT-ROBO Rho GTPase-activating protein 3 n=1 Tax=Hypsibius exemplaris TaxID=2072580 RepID=A0A1W0XA54_HYPEX|nr:SLIT-ROBO Rho GTPase-activating protein 3 [Hypsibius exemplaris]